MKWSAALLGVMVYLVWPYYTLVELAQAMRSGDAPTINQLVDWDRVRPSLKAQIQARLNEMPKTEADQKYPGAAAFGNAVAMTIVNGFIDRMLTPEGITRLIEGARAAKTSQEARPVTAQSADTAPKQSLYERVSYAFFISPIHFQLDLSAPDQNPTGGRASANDETMTLMLMFKGTGWQVSDVRMPKLNRASTMAKTSN